MSYSPPSPAHAPRSPRPPARLRTAAKIGAGVAAALLLVSCDDGYGHGFCDSCFPVTPVESSYGVVSADFNGDGFADIVALSTVFPYQGSAPSNLKTYLSTGDGSFATPTLTPADINPLYAIASDINGDGLPDVVTASFDDGALAIYFNNALTPGTFNTPLLLSSPGASQVAVADMNGDGLKDLISADFNVSLFLQTSPGTFAAPINLYPGGANWVAVGDLNGDGSADVALTDAVGVKVIMHTGAASATTFAAPVSVFTQTQNLNLQGANIIAIADVDGDGLNDLVITDPGPTGGMSPTVNILIQDPANHGSFLAAVSYPIAQQDIPQSIVMADLQGTGKLDIVIGELHGVTVLLHDPVNPGKYLAATTYAAAGANGITIADVNGDGKPDIVVSNGATNPTVSGVVTTHPGVLLQSTATPGSFGTLEDLP